MIKKVFAFDVDNTITPSGYEYSKWLISQEWFVDYFKNKGQATDMAFGVYSLADMNIFKNEHKKLMADWWKSETLYDDMHVTEQAEKLIKIIKSKGHDVIFVSHVEGIHGKSKYEMLKRHFGELDAFIATRNKNFVRCDYLIDDRSYNLFNLHPETKGIYIKTPYHDSTLDMINCPMVNFDTMGDEILDII